MFTKKRSYLFVCYNIEFWTPIIQTISRDYKNCIANSDFEICDANAIRNKTFSYFMYFNRIYVLGDKTRNEIKEFFDIDDSKICLIKTENKKRKNLEEVLFNALVQGG